MDERVVAIAEKTLGECHISRDDATHLAGLNGQEIYDLFHWANRIRHAYHGENIGLCSVISARQGSCAEDCKFCAQSVHHRTSIVSYPLLDVEKILHATELAKKIGSGRFGIVTSGESACDSDDWPAVLEAIKAVVGIGGITPCASLGSLNERAALELKAAGLQMYHHNLETSKRHFPNICSTHSFKDRVDTVRAAKAAGLDVCSGGIFGVGETWEDRIDLAFFLRELDVNSVPINFLNPIPGTPLENAKPIPALDLLKLIALYRFVLPKQVIRICGGRELGLRDLQSWMFYAGANGTMIGNYLTTQGRSPGEDWQMLKDLGFAP